MSVRINKITKGRFGNKIFQYNNLVQLANLLEVEASCVNWEGNKYFKNIVSRKPSSKKSKILYWNEILDNDIQKLKEMIKDSDLCIDDPSYALHNTFHKLTQKDPRHFLEFKEEYIPKINDNFIHVGIHIRGGDILGSDGQDGREIHIPGYYKRSIDYILKEDKNYYFHVCTDDTSFASFKETIEYLKSRKCKYDKGPNTGGNNYINDFALLCYCDILINSSSTFCLSAIFLGKKDKKIFHYQGWMDKIVKGDFSDKEYQKYIKVKKNKYTDKEWLEKSHNKARIFWINILNEKNNIFIENINFI